MSRTLISDFFRNCPICNKTLYYSNKGKLIRANKNNNPCQSCFAKERAKSKEYRKILSEQVKKSWENADDRRKAQSLYQKNFWKNLSEQDKNNICEKMSNAFNRSEERIANIRKITNNLWANKEFREKWERSNNTPEVSEKRRNNMLKQHGDPNSKINSKESRQKAVESIRKNWENKSPEEKKKILDNLSKTLHSFHSKSRSTSKLELWVAKNIAHLGFKSKGSVAEYCVDIIHETLPIIVEVNGDFWHANPKLYGPDWVNNINKRTAQEIWDKDAERLQAITNSGYEVIVLWQKDIKNNTDYIRQISDYIEKYKINKDKAT
jgi:very-short-patch-repair endonuclease